MSFFLLQAVAQVNTAPPQSVVSLGGWLAVIATAGGIAGAIYKLGRLAERVGTFETTVVKKLDEFIASSNSRLPEWSGWRASTDSRVGRVESDQEADKKARHDIREEFGGRLLDVESRVSTLEGERRNGPNDRRGPWRSDDP